MKEEEEEERKRSRFERDFLSSFFFLKSHFSINQLPLFLFNRAHQDDAFESSLADARLGKPLPERSPGVCKGTPNTPSRPTSARRWLRRHRRAASPAAAAVAPFPPSTTEEENRRCLPGCSRRGQPAHPLRSRSPRASPDAGGKEQQAPLEAREVTAARAWQRSTEEEEESEGGCLFVLLLRPLSSTLLRRRQRLPTVP